MHLFGPKIEESHHQLHTDWSDSKTESFAIWTGSGGKNSTECPRDLQIQSGEHVLFLAQSQLSL